MDEWQVVFYTTASGSSPVVRYLAGLDKSQQARVIGHIQKLKEFGLRLGAPHVKHLDGKIWELRVVGNVQHRVLYFAATGHALVLLHAFTKKTQQTPRDEIDTARSRMADYQRRFPDGPPGHL